MPTKKTMFLIPVTWHMSGTFRVEADTLKEAQDKVDGAEEPYSGLPKNGEYIDESMQIDMDRLRELNQGEEVGSYDTPQKVCPNCKSGDISNEGPADDGQLFVTCFGCGYQWHEPDSE